MPGHPSGPWRCTCSGRRPPPTQRRAPKTPANEAMNLSLNPRSLRRLTILRRFDLTKRVCPLPNTSRLAKVLEVVQPEIVGEVTTDRSHPFRRRIREMREQRD